MSEEKPRKLTKEDVLVDIRRIHKDITALVEEPTWSIREIDFVTHFLPVFSCQVEDDEKMGNWTRMANGPGHYVEVVDLAGNRLFLVPPLELPSIVDGDAPTASSMSIRDIYFHYRNISNGGKFGLANEYLNARMVDWLNKAKSDVNLQKYEQEWMEIFKRYNIEIKVDSVTNTDTKSESNNPIGYDPM